MVKLKAHGSNVGVRWGAGGGEKKKRKKQEKRNKKRKGKIKANFRVG
jgi:hypothetical protein